MKLREEILLGYCVKCVKLRQGERMSSLPPLQGSDWDIGLSSTDTFPRGTQPAEYEYCRQWVTKDDVTDLCKDCRVWTWWERFSHLNAARLSYAVSLFSSDFIFSWLLYFLLLPNFHLYSWVHWMSCSGKRHILDLLTLLSILCAFCPERRLGFQQLHNCCGCLYNQRRRQELFSVRFSKSPKWKKCNIPLINGVRWDMDVSKDGEGEESSFFIRMITLQISDMYCW